MSTSKTPTAGGAEAFAAAIVVRLKALAGPFPSCLLAFVLTGCAHGVPSLVLFGAYFPAWMLCAAIGIAGAIAARVVFVATGLSSVLPYQLLVCVSIGTIIALLVWLIWFGQ